MTESSSDSGVCGMLKACRDTIDCCFSSGGAIVCISAVVGGVGREEGCG